ncbi:hypothetical protein GQR58_021825 [Nymphon striatum]|nr:hypothetical protein GQR58_021825 [Nymphon striatum]
MRLSNQSRYNKDRGIFVGWFQVHPQFVGYDTDCLNKTIKVRGRNMEVNLTIVFNSITCDFNSSSEMELLSSELAPQLPFLFQRSHYGDQSTVVFDGYRSTTSTKVAEQRRRAQKCTSSDIIFEDNMPTTTTQSAFLTNSHNKQRLIHEKMLMSGIRIKQAEADYLQ